MKKLNVKFIEQKRNNMYYNVNGTVYGVDVNGGLVNEDGHAYSPYTKYQHTEETLHIQHVLTSCMIVDWFDYDHGVVAYHSPAILFTNIQKHRNIVMQEVV